MVSGYTYDLATPGNGRSRHRGIPYYRVTDPGGFNLARFASPDNLKLAWLDLKENGGQAAGSDDLNFRHYSPGGMFSVLRAVEHALVNQTYRPHPVKIYPIAKGDGRFRDLSIQCIPDRVVAKAFQKCFDKYYRRILPGIGRSVTDLFVDLQQIIRRHNTYFLQIDDIQDCFPSAPLDRIVECQNRHFQPGKLRWLAEQIVRGHEGFGKQTGIGQGSPYSPVAMEALLHHHFDTELDARYQGNLPRLRYADNLTFPVQSERQGQEILELAENILTDLGFRLKRKDGCIDLRDPNHNTTLLGLVPRWQNGKLTLSVPTSAYEGLKDHLLEATISDYPDRSAQLVVDGWLRASGPALTNAVNSDVINNIMSITRNLGFTGINRKELMRIAKGAYREWLNRCSHD